MPSHALLPKMGVRRIRIHEIPKQKHDKPNKAVKEMNMPYYSACRVH
ncbi:MAG: hypothetical protein QXP36_01225 [Conexivisphaerales archaeon]